MPIALAMAMAPAVCAAQPPLSMAEAIAFPSPVAKDLGWDGADRLTAAVRATPEGAAAQRTWSLDGAAPSGAPDLPHGAVSPDRRWAIYLDGATWRLRDLRTGAEQAVGESPKRAPTVVAVPVWSRDSARVAILERPAATRAAERPQTTEQGVRFIDVGADLAARDPSLGAAARVVIVDVDHPPAARAIEIAEDLVYTAAWGAGHDLYILPMDGPWNGKAPHWVLRRLDADTGRTEDLLSRGGVSQITRLAVSPDGGRILMNVDLDHAGWDDFDSLAVFDLKTRKLRRLTTDTYVNQGVWSADGRTIYVNARAGGLNQLHAVDLEGRRRALTDDQRKHFDLSLSPDGARLAYQTEDAYGRKDIRVRRLSDGVETVVAVLSDPAGSGRALARFEPVRWRADDGLELRGFLFFPPDFDPARRWPLYVDVHGGGPAAPLQLYSLFTGRSQSPLGWHAIANLGYVVFAPDIRSSGEYGPKVATDRYAAKDWDVTGMRRDADDVLAGVRALQARGFVDSSRIALFGHSAGGGRVNYLLTRSRLFSAGIIHDPIEAGALAMNLSLSTGRNTGRKLMAGLNGVSLEQRPEVFTGGFLFDGWRNRTPTLIMVGEHELGATDPLSSELLFSLLRTEGVPTRMVRYKGEGHNPTSDAGALHRFEQVKAWLDLYAPAGPR